ncbi:hypothetical protein GBAR_LOCUS19882 [Geodia barretti]|uniref:Uncharacterized protein n=1 Tax=Geodia barretti TaxID=519541 RepID=A0AA35SUW9_GEOBA|nr:hypothetical protein GBAR_LOCUS19882 [Geodia barretti]
MEEGDDVSLPLEDEDGYIQCNDLPVSDSTIYDSNFARKLSPTVLSRRPLEESEQWFIMGSRKRSKSLERLSAASVRPSTSRGGNASDADFSTAPRRRRRGQLEASPRAVAAPAPRIPPRPTYQLLNRFHQQRTNLSHPSPATPGRSASPAAQGRAPALPRKKYVALDVGVKEKGTAGGRRTAGTNSRNSPRLVSSTKAAQPRIGYTVLQIDSADGAASASPPLTPRVVVRRERAPVQRCKSTASERSVVVQRDPQPRHSAAYPIQHHHTQHSLCTGETLGVSPSLRKPRKLSAPNTVSLDEQNLSRELVNPVKPEESSASSLHIIDLRSGTTVYRDDSGSQAQRPPPPHRKPPTRPPAPLPRARKDLPNKPPTTTKIAGEPTDLEGYVEMSPADTTKRTSTSQLPNSGSINTTPLPRELRGQRGERGRGGKDRLPTPESEPEDFEAYSYVDLVKNRHLLSRDGQGPDAVGHPTTNTGGWEDGPLPVYTPLNFSMDGGGGMVDEGGGGKCAVSECSGYIRPVT